MSYFMDTTPVKSDSWWYQRFKSTKNGRVFGNYGQESWRLKERIWIREKMVEEGKENGFSNFFLLRSMKPGNDKKRMKMERLKLCQSGLGVHGVILPTFLYVGNFSKSMLEKNEECSIFKIC